MFRLPRRPKLPRRGVTLVEMLVTVALLVLMMTIIVQIFQAATGAVSAARTYQDLDGSLRQLDATIRQDLGNVTATFTPPLSPDDNRGYFEYIENSFADAQGEDSDDCLRFTVNAPEGQVFTGRMLTILPTPTQLNTLTLPVRQYFLNVQPITIQSQTAEIIYFLRNGNLYRRVLLIVPERQSSLGTALANFSNVPPNNSSFNNSSFQYNSTYLAVSFLGLSDVSARPSPSGSTTQILLNSLSDLTNREARYAAPRFVNDFVTNGTAATPTDSLPDDLNMDSVPDYWPTLTPLVVNNSPPSTPTAGLINEPLASGVTSKSLRSTVTGSLSLEYQAFAFPFIYPFAYSKPDTTNAFGWIHSPDPTNGGIATATKSAFQQLLALNHNPIDVGDSLPPPSGNQTWWGFPTWRETLSPSWTDPFSTFNELSPYPSLVTLPGPVLGLQVFDPTTLPSTNDHNYLPPMTGNLVGTVAGLNQTGVTTPYRTTSQLYTDGAGSDSFAAYTGSIGTIPVDALWRQAWEDDLVMTGVRSFDVKAYDNSYPGYVDLGWGDDLRLYAPYVSAIILSTTAPPFLTNNTTSPAFANPNTPSGFPILFNWPPGSTNQFRLIGDTFAHEGRMPPLFNDHRLDPQFVDAAIETQIPPNYKLNELNPRLPAASSTFFNVGDSNTGTSPGVIRLRRVWDSWSTEYTQAPGSGVTPGAGTPSGLDGGGPPIYPSYPPPYRAPLRGLQIQIRVVDPRNERIKVLTIRQDFSDKLGQPNQ